MVKAAMGLSLMMAVSAVGFGQTHAGARHGTSCGGEGGGAYGAGGGDRYVDGEDYLQAV